MNKLSILLYLAAALGDLKNLFLVFMIITGLSILLWWLIKMIHYSEHYSRSLMSCPWKITYVLFVLFGIIFCIVPSQTTVYMIAGSEAANTVVDSEIGHKLLKGIEVAIDNYTKKDDK